MKNVFIFIAVILFSLNSYCQDYSKELMKDLVIVKDGKYTATNFTLLTLSDLTTTFQIKAYAEAPAVGVINRDNFVAFFTVIAYEMINSLTDDKGAKTEDLEELIGNPDITINCFMNKTGVQIEVTGPEGTNRTTQKWSEFFKE